MGKKANVVKVSPEALGKAVKEITKIGHACRYVKHYPVVASELGKLKGMAYDEKLTAKENCSRLAVKVNLFDNKGKPLATGTKRDILRCYFRDNPKISPVINTLTGHNTLAEAKIFNAFSQHVAKRLSNEVK